MMDMPPQLQSLKSHLPPQLQQLCKHRFVELDPDACLRDTHHLTIETGDDRLISVQMDHKDKTAVVSVEALSQTARGKPELVASWPALSSLSLINPERQKEMAEKVANYYAGAYTRSGA